MKFNGCEGPSVETETCTDGSCPIWSVWSSWSDCSANCDGGIQSRTRQCQNGDEDECPGPAVHEQQCNRQSCDPGMLYWNDSMGHANGWKKIHDKYLPSGETMLDRCTSYCLSFTGCIAVVLMRLEYFTDQPSCRPNCDKISYFCHITDSQLKQPNTPWINVQPNYSYESVFAVVQDYYESYPDLFYLEPDGTTGADFGKVEGRCDQTNTGFGIVNYKKIDGIEFTSAVGKNIIRETGQVNCAVRCFEKAGCSAFFVDNNGCTYIIGEASYGDQNDNVTHSGTLNNLCPSTSFTSTFTRRSQFFCLIWAPNQGDTLADSIVAQNAGNSANLLRSWSFETQIFQISPMPILVT